MAYFKILQSSQIGHNMHGSRLVRGQPPSRVPVPAPLCLPAEHLAIVVLAGPGEGGRWRHRRRRAGVAARAAAGHILEMGRVPEDKQHAGDRTETPHRWRHIEHTRVHS